MTIVKGDAVPSAFVWHKDENGTNKLDFADFCRGKTIALFALPGAFTPTCQEQHFPSYQENAQAMKAKGVDVIACMSVNDHFVMQAWGNFLDPEDNIMMLADGNGDLAKALGLSVDRTEVGLGLRSSRFSMLIKDGIVSSLNIEKLGAYEISGAEVLLEDL